MFAISRASPEDAASILALQRLASDAKLRRDDGTIAPPDQSVAELRGELTAGVAIKATASGQLLGAVRAQLVDGVCHICRLVVKPQCPYAGLDWQLLAAIEAAYPDATAYQLQTGHGDPLQLTLYQRSGYQISPCAAAPSQPTLIQLRKPRATE